MTTSTSSLGCSIAVRGVLLLLLCSSPSTGVDARKRPQRLVLYAHESRVGPSPTLVVSASPSGNTTRDEFGMVRTVSNVLRESASNTSTILGSQVGLVVLGKDVLNVYLSFTYFLNNNSEYKGTIAVHGHIDATYFGDRVFAVVGGTDDFVSVTGTDTSPIEGVIYDETNVVNVHTLDLSYMTPFDE